MPSSAGQQSSGLTVAALVLGITSATAGLVPVLGILLGLTGAVLALLALRQSTQRATATKIPLIALGLSFLAILTSVFTTSFASGYLSDLFKEPQVAAQSWDGTYLEPQSVPEVASWCAYDLDTDQLAEGSMPDSDQCGAIYVVLQEAQPGMGECSYVGSWGRSAPEALQRAKEAQPAALFSDPGCQVLMQMQANTNVVYLATVHAGTNAYPYYDRANDQHLLPWLRVDLLEPVAVDDEGQARIAS